MDRVLDWVLGRRLATREEQQEKVGVPTGISVLGLDGLSSAAYGPEAALTVLIPLGAASALYLGPIIAIICAVLALVATSYRQTIAAYPNGGGSYTVASENLGPGLGVLAGAALALDYVLNVAVGISAGVAALASAVPALLPHTLAVCLAILALITLLNLRGVKESGAVFAVPTFAFLVALAVVLLVGTVRAIAAGGSPEAVVAPPRIAHVAQTASAWLLVRAFANGCTAMTGVEAVSNAVPIFRDPAIPRARHALLAIVGCLIVLLAGVAYLCRAYGITAQPPGAAGYQTVLSMITAAVFGRGAIYYVTIAAILAVLALSANTSFSGFPRLCRLLALHRYLPGAFADRGRRLVFTHGIVLLAVLAAMLLIAFEGVTDRLIPLFAVGALLAFTLSQAGMVAHWRRSRDRHARRSMLINGAGAIATGLTLCVVVVSKLTEGAWLVLVVLPALVVMFVAIHRHYRHIADQIATFEPMEQPELQQPIAVLAARTWNKVTQHGLKFALRLSDDIHVVRIKTEHDPAEDLRENWDALIARPARHARIAQPRLIVLTSLYREFFKPFVDFVSELERANPDREIAVVIPELIVSHWYQGLFEGTHARTLRMLILARCSDRVVVITPAFHLRE
ncbi:MAG TPA: APC family permease [Kofleriaceae bacterium]|jgi:amino acid transporter